MTHVHQPYIRTCEGLFSSAPDVFVRVYSSNGLRLYYLRSKLKAIAISRTTVQKSNVVGPEFTWIFARWESRAILRYIRAMTSDSKYSSKILTLPPPATSPCLFRSFSYPTRWVYILLSLQSRRTQDKIGEIEGLYLHYASCHISWLIGILVVPNQVSW